MRVSGAFWQTWTWTMRDNLRDVWLSNCHRYPAPELHGKFGSEKNKIIVQQATYGCRNPFLWIQSLCLIAFHFERGALRGLVWLERRQPWERCSDIWSILATVAVAFFSTTRIITFMRAARLLIHYSGTYSSAGGHLFICFFFFP